MKIWRWIAPLALSLLWMAGGVSSLPPEGGVNSNLPPRTEDVRLVYQSIEKEVFSGRPESPGLPLIEEDKMGRVWAAWEDWRDGRSQVEIGRLGDDGLLIPVLTAAPADSNFSPDLAFDPGDSLWAAWGNFADGRYSIYIQNIASPRRWRLPASEDAAVTDPKLIFDGDGVVWIFWNETREQSWQIVSRRFDGNVWSPKRTILEATSFPTVNPDVFLDGKGFIWLAWSGYDGRDYEIYLTRWDGKAWGSPVALTNNEENDLFPSLVIGPDDLPVVSWQRSSAGWNQVFAATYRENGALQEAAVSPPVRGSVLSRIISLEGTTSIIWKSADGLETRQLPLLMEVPDKRSPDPSPQPPLIFNPERDENSYIGFGDSITYGYIDRLPTPDLGYPPRLDAILDQNFGPTEMINEGLGGENTLMGLGRIDEVLDSQTARYILIMEGTNDVINHSLSMDTSAFNIKEMARKSLEAGAFPTITTIIPRRDWIWSNPQVRARQSDLNNQIRELPTELHVSFIDMDSLFLHYPAEDGGLLSLLSNDLKHPSEKGYEFMAEAWFNEIRNYPFPPHDIRLRRMIPDREAPEDAVIKPFRVVGKHRQPVSQGAGHFLFWKVNPKIFNPARIKGYNIYRTTRDIPGDNFYLLAFVIDFPRFLDSGFHVLGRYKYIISTIRDDDVEGPCAGPIGQ